MQGIRSSKESKKGQMEMSSKFKPKLAKKSLDEFTKSSLSE